MGHTTLNCTKRFNHAYQAKDHRSGNSATFRSYNIEPSWYINTGATDHLTSDLDRLSIPERYHGKDHV